MIRKEETELTCIPLLLGMKRSEEELSPTEEVFVAASALRSHLVDLLEVTD